MNNYDLGKIQSQRSFWESENHEILFSGAWRAGKSLCMCLKAVEIATKGRPVLLCRKSQVDFRDTTLRVLKEVLAPAMYKSWNKSERMITVEPPNGYIYYCGLDNPNKVLSSEYAFIGVDEGFETTEEDWLFLKSRLSYKDAPFRQIATTTNPSAPTHYLFQRFIENPHSDRDVFYANTLENPFLIEDYIKQLKDLPERYYRRFVLGLWESFEGMIYEDFNKSLIIEPFSIPQHWPALAAIDFGYYPDPFVWGLWRNKPGTKEWYLQKEIYRTNTLVEDHAKDIKKTLESLNLRSVQTYADHDAEDRATLLRHGIPTSPALKNVMDGIQFVAEHFKQRCFYYFRDALIHPPDIILQSERRPIKTTEELGGYQWNPKTGDPVKKNDHGCDMQRYFAYSSKLGGGKITIQPGRKSEWNGVQV